MDVKIELLGTLTDMPESARVATSDAGGRFDFQIPAGNEGRPADIEAEKPGFATSTVSIKVPELPSVIVLRHSAEPLTWYRVISGDAATETFTIAVPPSIPAEQRLEFSGDVTYLPSPKGDGNSRSHR